MELKITSIVLKFDRKIKHFYIIYNIRLWHCAVYRQPKQDIKMISTREKKEKGEHRERGRYENAFRASNGATRVVSNVNRV